MSEPTTGERAMRRAVCDWLVAQRLTPIFEVHFGSHLCDFVGVEFADRTGRLLPEIVRLVAVELKLSDVAGVLKQCQNCRLKAHAAYAAMPSARCSTMRHDTVERFAVAGVGLLSVSDGVEVVVPAYHSDPNLQGFWRESFRRKLWRRKNEWMARLERWETRKEQRREP